MSPSFLQVAIRVSAEGALECAAPAALSMCILTVTPTKSGPGEPGPHSKTLSRSARAHALREFLQILIWARGW
jgi:hypothetical protein